MHLNHYENPYSRLAQYDELRMRQHGSLPKLYADDLWQYTSLNNFVVADANALSCFTATGQICSKYGFLVHNGNPAIWPICWQPYDHFSMIRRGENRDKDNSGDKEDKNDVLQN